MNNLHIITLYKVHDKAASRTFRTRHVERVEPVELDVSSVSCRAVLFDKLNTAKMHGLDTSNVSCQDEMSQVEFGLINNAHSCIMHKLLQASPNGHAKQR